IESTPDELIERVRNRQRLGCTQRRASLQEEARDLEGVERIAARGPMHLAKRRPGQRPVEAPEDGPVERTEPERPAWKTGGPPQRPKLEAVQRNVVLRASGDDELDVFLR